MDTDLPLLVAKRPVGAAEIPARPRGKELLWNVQFFGRKIASHCSGQSDISDGNPDGISKERENLHMLPG
ncbi:MAG: hypothetical protein ACXWN9_00390, partial [Candidatus Binataceae bacterium]